MPHKKTLVIVTRKLPEAVETRMRELFDTRLNETDQPMTQAELVEAVKTAHVLVPTVTDRIDETVLAQAGRNLRLIANFGNGVDNIDVAGADTRGIAVTNRATRRFRMYGCRQRDGAAPPTSAPSSCRLCLR